MDSVERTLYRDVPVPVSRPPAEKLNRLVLPGTLTFQGTSFYDMLAYLRQESVRLDVEEADEERRGVPVWIVDGEGRCTAGAPGESRSLDRMVAHLYCHLEIVDLPLGHARDVLARCFGLETRVSDEAVFLWLPGALPGGRITSPALRALKEKMKAACELLRRHGYNTDVANGLIRS